MKKYLFPLVAILLFGFFGMILFWGSSSIIWLILIIVLAVVFFAWVMPMILKRVKVKVWIISGLLILFGLIFPTSLLMSRDFEFGPFSTLTSTTLFLLPSLALVIAAFLLFPGLSSVLSGTTNDRTTKFSFVLGILLVIKTLHNVYVLTLWDNTYDPLGYLWLIIPIFVVLLCGLALSIALPGRTKLTGITYSVVTSILLIVVSALAQSVDFRQETTRRAERTVQAIESYYAREGSYPEALSQLSPWYGISLPKPMIIYGQDWCYESGEDYYRLGYIDREHWSNPNLIGRVYKSVGEVPDLLQTCNMEFMAIQYQNLDYPYTFEIDAE